MTDPLSLLTKRFTDAIVSVLGEEFEGSDPGLRRSRRADLQVDGILALARAAGRDPVSVAEEIAARVASEELADEVKVSGPGFINITLRPTFLAHQLALVGLDPFLGVERSANPDVVVIDYSSPNVAKEMHVGHLRSTVIGDALVRVLEFLGHTVIRQNHLGDWGTQYGLLIEYLKDLRANAGGSDYGSLDLNEAYREAQMRFDRDTAFAERARRRVVALQSGDAETLSEWRDLVAQSLRQFKAVYDRLGVRLQESDARGESFYNPFLDETIEELESKRLVTQSEGAVCAFPPGFYARDGSPLPLIARKRDGGYGYGGTDLAAARFRSRALRGTRLIYVTDTRQSQHFAMVFAVARQAGWLNERVRAEHVPFGSVLGPDGKPLKARSGESVKLIELLDQALERAGRLVDEKSPELDEAVRRSVARMVGIGAVKYSDLATDRVKDYVFDWNRMLRMDGNTAPYLQYAHARIRSIFRRAEESVSPEDFESITLAEKEERDLALQLLGFSSAVSAVGDDLAPHLLCTYLFDLATRFTSFYERHRVLRARTVEQRRSRLALCEVTARTLKTGLNLLGIEAPDRI